MTLSTAFAELPEQEQAGIVGVYFANKFFDLAARAASGRDTKEKLSEELQELRLSSLAQHLPELATDGSGNNPRAMFYQLCDDCQDLIDDPFGG